MKDIYYPDESYYSQNLRQAKGMESLDMFNNVIYRDFLAGYRTQNSFIADKKPGRVTVSISGNDIGFGDILVSCLMPGTCYASPQERVNLAYTINSKFDPLVFVLQQAKFQAAAGARIYAIGYPKLSDPDGNCAVNVHLDKQELVFANQIVGVLNEVIRRAALKAGARYIDVQDALSGHRLCETRSSDIAVNGLTAGNDKLLTGMESYHPNRLGHQLLADAIIRATRGFEEPSPPPVPLSETPSLGESSASLGATTTSLTPSKLNPDESISAGVILSGKGNSIRASNYLPGSGTSVTLQGPSGFKGTGPVVSTKGDFLSEVQIPAGLRTGFYTLGIEGRNIAGEEISSIKTVYVAMSQDDLDGDGIPNTQERCLVMGESGEDSDGDGSDDACDPQISVMTSGMPTLKITPLLNERNTNTQYTAQVANSSGVKEGKTSETETYPEFTDQSVRNSISEKTEKNEARAQSVRHNPLIIGAVLFPAAIVIYTLGSWFFHWRKK